MLRNSGAVKWACVCGFSRRSPVLTIECWVSFQARGRIHAWTTQPGLSKSTGIVKSPDGKGHSGSVLTSPPSLETAILTMWFGSVVCPVITPSVVAVLIQILGCGFGAVACLLVVLLVRAGTGDGFGPVCCAGITPHKITKSAIYGAHWHIWDSVIRKHKQYKKNLSHFQLRDLKALREFGATFNLVAAELFLKAGPHNWPPYGHSLLCIVEIFSTQFSEDSRK